MEANVMIWDGEDFNHVTQDEADRLVKADKAQILDGTVDGLGLRYRAEFTGYKTRELRAAGVRKPSVAEPTETGEEPAISEADWKDYKAEAAKALDKPYNKTTKKDTIAFLKKKYGNVV